MVRQRNSIQSPEDPKLAELCDRMRDCVSARSKLTKASDSNADLVQQTEPWPAEQLKLCGDYGVFEWFLPEEVGGQAWNEPDVVRGYLALSSACLTTTFVITQRMGACKRIAASQNDWLKSELLPDLISGKTFSTVGISHLTTSRRHLGKPALRARSVAGGFELTGFCPWVTGAIHADSVVVGATLEDDRQVLLTVPRDLPGISIPQPPPLVGLNGSKTGQMQFDGVRVDDKWNVDGPVHEVMKRQAAASTGGLQTSTLAIGLGRSTVEFLATESEQRDELVEAYASLKTELDQLEEDLILSANGDKNCSAQQIRTRANSFVLRATQASLAAAKGSGYVVGHDAGRWCMEALFFLVWSCPQPVMQANLCELAGIVD